MKVLSLFFIDRVARYAGMEGDIRRWFERAYEELSAAPANEMLPRWPVARVHAGYFAQSRGAAVDTSGRSAVDEAAYTLIMKDKERLLSLEEPVRFIFSHSALREGWDNPNVFQICTLNTTRSELRKRQEIGRGLRLPVRQDGSRCGDPAVATLTVVANERYERFARELQTELKESSGVDFGDRIIDRRQRTMVALKDGWHQDKGFLRAWSAIARPCRYRVDFDVAALIIRGGQAVAGAVATDLHGHHITHARLGPSGAMVEKIGERWEGGTSAVAAEWLPDILAAIASRLSLSRSTVLRILEESGSYDAMLTRPRAFLDQALRAISGVLDELIARGVVYEVTGVPAPPPDRFAHRPVALGRGRLIPVSRSIYGAVKCDNDAEARLVSCLESDPSVRFFMRVPRWFTLPTPVGAYHPGFLVTTRDAEGWRVHLLDVSRVSDAAASHRRRCAAALCGVLDLEYGERWAMNDGLEARAGAPARSPA